jgi:hypothetical protein
MVRDNRHVSTYIFGAICPERGVGAAMIMPYANTEAMNAHLKEISTEVAPGAHAVLVCDGAGWHQRGERLIVPNNITLLSLPCRLIHLSSTLWRMPGPICGKTNFAHWSGIHTKRYSMPVKAPGASSSTIQTESDQSEPANGRVSVHSGPGIIFSECCFG